MIVQRVLLTAILIAVVDLPWLLFNMSHFNTIVRTIQGGIAPQFRPAAGIPVYLALAYLLGNATSLTEAFFIGAATYAVYDFTVLFAFRAYPIATACLDVVWGGILFSITYWILRKTNI
jgi:uncharacterized membrane protein